MARVSVVVPNYNGRHHLDECLGALAQQDIQEPFDVLVADNGSSDQSVAHIEAHHPGVRIVKSATNLGFAAACNRAIRLTSSEFVVLLNNDTKVAPDWLRQLVRCADDSGPDVFAVGSVLALYDHPDRVNSSGGLFSPMGGGFDVGLGEPLPASSRSQAYETAIAPGAAVLYKRRLYDAVGGLDDDFFLYFEDVELCYRAWKQGLRSIMAPNAMVWHKHGATSGARDSPLKVYWCQRNRLRSIARNQSAPWALKAAVTLLVYTLWKGWSLARDQGPAAAWPLWRATRDGLRDLPQYRKPFRAEREQAVRSDRDLARAGLVASVPMLVREGARLRRLTAAGIRV